MGLSRNTAEFLADELQKADAPAAMVQLARVGHFDDFKSPLAFPLMELMRQCRKHGLTSIAQRVINGEFDSTKEESDAWARSPEGQQAFRDIVEGSKGRSIQ